MAEKEKNEAMLEAIMQMVNLLDLGVRHSQKLDVIYQMLTDIKRDYYKRKAEEKRKAEDDGYIYCSYEGQRKYSSPPSWANDTWEEYDFDRGDYMEEGIIRKKRELLTEEEKEAIKEYDCECSKRRAV